MRTQAEPRTEGIGDGVTEENRVIGLYLAGTLGLSGWLARRQQTAADYYVGGRTLPWWALAISILATQSSANSFIGIPAYVALVPGGGLTWLQYELMLPLAMIVVMLVLVAGIGLCAAIAWDLAGGGMAIVERQDPARRAAVEWAHGIGDGARAPLWGFVVGGLVLYISYYGVDQSQAQRTLSSTHIAGAQRALVFNGIARFPLTLAYAALGLAIGAVAVSEPALRDAVPPSRPDLPVPRFIELYLLSGARGLLVAAILAAAMSSLDSALNSLSAATLRDFVEPHLESARTLRAGRLVTAAWGCAIVGFAFLASDLSTSVVESINRVGALFYGPLLAAFACGILDRRARGPAVLAGVAAGLGVNLLLAATMGAALFWMWWNVTGLVVAAAVTVLGSRLMAPPAPQALAGTTIDAATLRRAFGRQRGLVLLLLGWSVLCAVVALWLGVR